MVDEAELPGAPLPPSPVSRYGYPMAGMLFGALISAAYLYLMFRTDHTIRSSQDLQGIGVPVLGFVPWLEPQQQGPQQSNRFGFVKRRVERDFARNVAASLG